jgi:hypothetical protein
VIPDSSVVWLSPLTRVMREATSRAQGVAVPTQIARDGETLAGTTVERALGGKLRKH